MAPTKKTTASSTTAGIIKKRKILTKKEKEACRAATEQLEAIFKGGPKPYILRPQALNLVVSKGRFFAKRCAILSCLHLFYFLIHCFIFYFNFTHQFQMYRRAHSRRHASSSRPF